MATKLRGIIPPLVTPLLNDSELDIAGLERLVEHVVRGGVHGVFILGTTGEAQSISFCLREKMIKETSRILNGRLPLLVGISDTSIQDSIHLADIAADSGANAVVSAPPYYYATGQPELTEFYERLIPELPLPIYLYNMPTHTKVSFDPYVLQRLSGYEKVVGFKDSSANGAYLSQVIHLLKTRDDFSILVGPEEMTAAMVMLGADGGVNGGANLFPELYVQMYDVASSGDIRRVAGLQERIMDIAMRLYSIGSYGSSYLKGLKCALSLKGICNGYVASPFNQFDKEYVERVRQVLDSISVE